ncbi:MAG: hypothetical protein K0S48_7 [Ramlibacter sp.]|jgi:hypothetical protein|nr:hypothetical protein [Ramlibacter sp.]
MSALLKSNKATTGAAIYPAGMATYVARVIADGGQINDFNETYTVFKALEDVGLTSSQVVAVAGAPFGVKVSGSNVTKLYDFWSSSRDFTPNGAAAGTTLDTAAGYYQLDFDPAAGTGVNRAAFRAATAHTGTANPFGVIAALTMDNPTAAVTMQLAIFENTTSTTSFGGMLSSPSGDGKSRIGFQSYDPSLGIAGFMYRKNLYAAGRVIGVLHTNGAKSFFKDGECERSDEKTIDTYYAAKSLTPAIGNVNTAPAFKFRFGLWINGAMTQGQMQALTSALGAL